MEGLSVFQYVHVFTYTSLWQAGGGGGFQNWVLTEYPESFKI